MLPRRATGEFEVKRIGLLLIALGLAACVGSSVGMDDLQGAWWSDEGAPTADFGIRGQEVWLDSDTAYHPCRIEGDVLVFELGEGLGEARQRIVSLEGDRLVLESVVTGERRTLKRVRE